MFHVYEYCTMMKKKNVKFTFSGLNMVISVDGRMGRYSYIDKVWLIDTYGEFII